MIYVPSGVYPKTQGVYGHSACIRGGNTLVVVGGFHGTVNGQVLAYVLPAALIPPTGHSINTDHACRMHVTMVSHYYRFYYYHYSNLEYACLSLGFITTYYSTV